MAKKLGGRRVPASGGLSWTRKKQGETDGGDISLESFFIEHKYTKKESISLKREWLMAITEAALRHSKEPALVVTFDRGSKPPEDWLLLPMHLATRLLR